MTVFSDAVAAFVFKGEPERRAPDRRLKRLDMRSA
jgi:hypothetical protein